MRRMIFPCNTRNLVNIYRDNRTQKLNCLVIHFSLPSLWPKFGTVKIDLMNILQLYSELKSVPPLYLYIDDSENGWTDIRTLQNFYRIFPMIP